MMEKDSRSIYGFDCDESFDLLLSASFNMSNPTSEDLVVQLIKIRAMYEELLLQQADEMNAMVKQNTEKVDELKSSIAVYMEEIEKLQEEKADKEAIISKYNDFFGLIQHRFNRFFDDFGNNNTPKEVICANIEIMSESEPDTDENGESDDQKNDGNPIQHMEEDQKEQDEEVGEDDHGASTEDDETAFNDENNQVHNDEGSGKENVRPQSTPIAAKVNQIETVELPPVDSVQSSAAPRAPLVENSNLQTGRDQAQTIQSNGSKAIPKLPCFKCEEVFVKMSSFGIHLKHEHGIEMHMQTEPKPEPEAGKYVRAPKKRTASVSEDEEIPVQDTNLMHANPMKQAQKRSKLNKQ